MLKVYPHEDIYIEAGEDLTSTISAATSTIVSTITVVATSTIPSTVSQAPLIK